MSAETTGRFDRAQAIYWAVAELPRGDRDARLAAACGDDADLRALVDRLLSVDADSLGDFLTPVRTPLATLTTGATGGAHDLPALTGTVGHYEIVRQLGRGGGGVVYEARDTRLDRRVALKVVGRATPGIDRTVHEARVLAALNHPCIATVHARETIDGAHFIVQEYIDGRSLRERLAAPLRTDEVLDVGIGLASALEAAHAVGVVHRDLKPENVMLTTDARVKVLDFGIAVLVRDGDGRSDRMGTPGYMSPEHLRGAPPRPSQDVWSLGCVL